MLSVVIPARDEEGCVAGTVEHLHLELDLQKIPHEIVVVEDVVSRKRSPYIIGAMYSAQIAALRILLSCGHKHLHMLTALLQ